MFVKTDLHEMKDNVFTEFARNWMLLSAKNPAGKVNTMTIGWGALGVIWGKDAATVYVRQSRYTKEFMDSQEYFTLSLFEGHKPELKLLGTKSGRDGDKIAEAGLNLAEVEGQPAFEESKGVLVCKKMYQADIPMDAMPAQAVETFYKDGDIHTMYVGEIVGYYVNR